MSRRLVAMLTALSVGAIAGIATMPAPAQAASATVARNGAEVVYRAVSGQVNRLVISEMSSTVLRFDDVVPLAPGTGCRQVFADLTAVDCDATATVEIQADTGDLADTITKRSRQRSILAGGAGPDTIDGGPARVEDDQHNFPLWNNLYGGPVAMSSSGAPTTTCSKAGPTRTSSAAAVAPSTAPATRTTRPR